MSLKGALSEVSAALATAPVDEQGRATLAKADIERLLKAAEMAETMATGLRSEVARLRKIETAHTKQDKAYRDVTRYVHDIIEAYVPAAEHVAAYQALEHHMGLRGPKRR